MLAAVKPLPQPQPLRPLSRGRRSDAHHIVTARFDGRPFKLVEPNVPQRREWPFPKFIDMTLAKFATEGGVCDVEEARVLEEEAGYKFLDVRSKAEHEYKIGGCINVPLINAVFRFNVELKRKVPEQSANANFIADVQAKFPDKASKLIIFCSDGRIRTLSALRALDEAGYTMIVGMRGGYNGFSNVFDNRFYRRVEPDAMKEVAYSNDFPDQSTGIFGTGASYDRTDSIAWAPKNDPEKWIDWQEAMEKKGAT